MLTRWGYPLIKKTNETISFEEKDSFEDDIKEDLFNYEVHDKTGSCTTDGKTTGDKLNETWVSIYNQIIKEELPSEDVKQQEAEETLLVEEYGLFFEEHNLKRLQILGTKCKRLNK